MKKFLTVSYAYRDLPQSLLRYRARGRGSSTSSRARFISESRQRPSQPVWALASPHFGGALGQGKGVAAALDGIARNPGASGKIFAPMIIGLALIESLVIYAFVVSLILVGKL